MIWFDLIPTKSNKLLFYVVSKIAFSILTLFLNSQSRLEIEGNRKYNWRRNVICRQTVLRGTFWQKSPWANNGCPYQDEEFFQGKLMMEEQKEVTQKVASGVDTGTRKKVDRKISRQNAASSFFIIKIISGFIVHFLKQMKILTSKFFWGSLFLSLFSAN